MKRRYVSTFFAAVASLAASAVSFTPEGNASFYREASAGEQLFVGTADSVEIKVTDDEELAKYHRLVSGEDTLTVSESKFKIGPDKCYTFLYASGLDAKKEPKLATKYLCYVKMTAVAPTVEVLPFDSVYNPVCGEELEVKFKDFSFANTYVNSKGVKTEIKDNFVLTYIDYVADGINIKEDQVEVTVGNLASDTSMTVKKPRRNGVFKLKDKITQYEYVSDTFRTPLPFSVAQLSIEAEKIPHNIEQRGEEGLSFIKLDEAKSNISNYLFSAPLSVNIERNSVDNLFVDTLESRYVWKFFNDSTGTLKNSYRVRYNDKELYDEPISDFGSHYIALISTNGVCTDTIVAAFKVRISELTMPTVFTPNGDNINDEFRPTYTSIRKYKIWIYNTMGKRVYESEDITVGWDGTYKGNETPIGAYYYVVEAEGVDGTEYKLKGTVNLLRDTKD